VRKAYLIFARALRYDAKHYAILLALAGLPTYQAVRAELFLDQRVNFCQYHSPAERHCLMRLNDAALTGSGAVLTYSTIVKIILILEA
jgi:hypothetical protein